LGRLLGTPQQLGQVVEGIDSAQQAGLDQTHVEVAHEGPAPGLVEERILAVEDRFFQGLFANVVVQRRSRLAKEEGELFPVFEHVAEGLAQSGVRFHPLLVQLLAHPLVEIIQYSIPGVASIFQPKRSL
jgi:hypothetical protein